MSPALPQAPAASSVRFAATPPPYCWDCSCRWVFKHTDRVKAERLVLLGQEEWGRGAVKVRNLATRDEAETPIASLGL